MWDVGGKRRRKQRVSQTSNGKGVWRGKEGSAVSNVDDMFSERRTETFSTDLTV